VSELLNMCGVTVELPTAAEWVRPVNGVSLRIGAGERVGLVGESRSGKTMLSLALMGLLPVGARVSGEVLLGGGEEGGASSSPTKDVAKGAKNLVGIGEEEWRRMRGREIAMIFQEPMTSLNPVMCVGAQIKESILAHEPKFAKELQHRLIPPGGYDVSRLFQAVPEIPRVGEL
jgi:ABC-type dipeptide/oligopeptide/nickel transport system ATPase component